MLLASFAKLTFPGILFSYFSRWNRWDSGKKE